MLGGHLYATAGLTELDAIIAAWPASGAWAPVLRLDSATGRAVVVVVVHIPLAIRLLRSDGVVRGHLGHNGNFLSQLIFPPAVRPGDERQRAEHLEQVLPRVACSALAVPGIFCPVKVTGAPLSGRSFLAASRSREGGMAGR